MRDVRKFKLSETFLSEYKVRKPDWGPAGEFIYLRTYSRLLEDNRKEQWWETVKRVVEGCFTIQKNHCHNLNLPWEDRKAQRSAKIMYEKMFSFKFLPPGRSLWLMGTSFVDERGSACLNNCGAVSTRDLDSKPFTWTMDALMLGVGVGFDTDGAGKLIIKEPKTRFIKKFVIPDSREGWVESLGFLLDAYFHGKHLFKNVYSKIRERGKPIRGFGGVASGPEPLERLHNMIVELLDQRIGSPIKSTDIVDIMNMIGVCVVAGNVRRCLPKTSLVHTKNGLEQIQHVKVGTEVLTSDGYEKVSAIFNQGVQKTVKINTQDGEFVCTPNHRMAVLNNFEDYTWKQASELKPKDKLISSKKTNGHYIPVEVLSVEDFEEFETFDLEVENKHEFFCEGYLVHNSAELSLGEADDTDFVTMKDYNLFPKEVSSHRWSSNNSIKGLVGKTDYDRVSKSIALNGEPGIIWLENIRKYGRLKDGIQNNDRKACLVNPCAEISLESYELCNLSELFPSRHESFQEFKQTIKFAYLYAKTVSLLPTHWQETNAVMMKNRRIGLSQSGIIDAFNLHGRREMLKWCDEAYTYTRELDHTYSDWLCVPKSIKITTVKPSGTISFLPGVSPGIHYPHDEYYKRTFRLADTDPLVQILRNANYHVEPAVVGTGTMVVSFPVKEENFDRKKDDVSIWEQIKNCSDYQTYWADNNVSITVTFNKNEAKDIKHVLESYEDKLKSVSFLPISEHGYEQAPYESISKEVYEEMSKNILPLNFTSLTSAPTGEKYCDSDKCML